MLNKHNALEKRRLIEAEIEKIDLRLSRLPSKHIFCTKNGKSFKWYESNGKKYKYIPKKRRAYAEKLAEKKYLTLLRNDLEKEKIALDFYLRHHSSIGESAERLLTENPAYVELLAPYFKPTSKELFDWMNSPYEKQQNYNENLIHKTVSGIMVRSKSEALIVMILHSNKIPFRYECCLRFGEKYYYPDFTIRHPEDGRTFYWEHFGLMDDPDYRKKMFDKLKQYADHGLIIGVNLIVTCENKMYPLQQEQVESLVKQYFM